MGQQNRCRQYLFPFESNFTLFTYRHHIMDSNFVSRYTNFISRLLFVCLRYDVCFLDPKILLKYRITQDTTKMQDQINSNPLKLGNFNQTLSLGSKSADAKISSYALIVDRLVVGECRYPVKLPAVDQPCLSNHPILLIIIQSRQFYYTQYNQHPILNTLPSFIHPPTLSIFSRLERSNRNNHRFYMVQVFTTRFFDCLFAYFLSPTTSFPIEQKILYIRIERELKDTTPNTIDSINRIIYNSSLATKYFKHSPVTMPNIRPTHSNRQNYTFETPPSDLISLSGLHMHVFSMLRQMGDWQRSQRKQTSCDLVVDLSTLLAHSSKQGSCTYLELPLHWQQGSSSALQGYRQILQGAGQVYSSQLAKDSLACMIVGVIYLISDGQLINNV